MVKTPRFAECILFNPNTMKKLFFTLILLLALAPFASADFDNGQTDDGFYCFNEACNIVYSKDGSLIGDYNHRNALGSSVWYVKSNQMKMSDSYLNRVRLMK